MPGKSKAERERLQMASKAQSILMQAHSVASINIQTLNTSAQNGDTYEPAGEIDYSKYKR